MKLTKEIIDRLVREVIAEHRGVAMKDRGVNGKSIARQRAQENEERSAQERERKDKVSPGLSSLLALGRGVITESDVEEEDDFIKIKKDALDRLLVETNDQLKAKCNQIGYKSLEQWLRLSNAFADAAKGKFGEDK